MARFGRHLRFLLGVGRFYHQRIRASTNFDQIIGAPHIANVNVFGSPYLFAQHFVGVDGTAVGQGDGLPSHQTAALGAKGHTECFRFFGKERPSRLLLKGKTQTPAAAMVYLESCQRKFVIFEDDLPRCGVDEADGNGGLVAAQSYAIDEVVDAVEGLTAAVNL